MHVVLLSVQSSCDESERLQSKTFVQGPNQVCFSFLGGHPILAHFLKFFNVNKGSFIV